MPVSYYRYYTTNNFLNLKAAIQKTICGFYIFMIPVSIVAVYVFLIMINAIFPVGNYGDATKVFSALVFGILLSAGYLPLSTYLIQIGRPLTYTVTGVVMIAINITVNIVLIPKFGMLGAAYGRVFAYTASAICIHFFIKRSIGSYLLSSNG